MTTMQAAVVHAFGKDLTIDNVPVPAGTFSGGKAVVVKLDGNAVRGHTVAITVEPAGGSKAPTTQPVAKAALA